MSIHEDFARFHSENPEIYRYLVDMARKYKARQHRKRIGIGMLFEVLRWNRYMQTKRDEGEFKLNNNYRSHYARLIMDLNRDLSDIFETRTLRSL